MKKLLLLVAAFIFVAATATFAQTADQDAAKQGTVKSSVAAEKSDTPKACCKAGSSKSCCKSGASMGKSCGHDHADAGKDENKAGADKATPVGSTNSSGGVEEPKK